MGKIKQKRHTLHLAAPKFDQDKGRSFDKTQFTDVQITPIQFEDPESTKKINLFKNIHIPSQVLKQKLPEYSKKDRHNLEVKQHILHTKPEALGKPKGRYCRKKIPFCEVVSSALEFLEKRRKEEAKKAGTLGNFNTLKDALPTLDDLLKESNANMGNSGSKDTKIRVAKTFAQRDAEMMEDVQTFHQVLNDAQYNSDPFGTITAQLKQKLLSGSL